MSTFNNECLILSQHFKILLNKTILHPVLTDLPRFAISDEFVWIESNVEAEIIVNHHLESLSCQAFAFVLVDWLAVDSFLRSVTVSVNSAAGRQFLHELRRQLCVQLLRYVS